MATPVPQDQAVPVFPLGYRGVRGAILVELKKAQPLTTKELAARLSVSLNAVRHHLKDLEEQELVAYQREHRGVGAPTFSYRLAQAGEALFPRRYEATLAGLLDGLVDRDGRSGVVAMLEARYATWAATLQEQFANRSPEE